MPSRGHPKGYSKSWGRWLPVAFAQKIQRRGRGWKEQTLSEKRFLAGKKHYNGLIKGPAKKEDLGKGGGWEQEIRARGTLVG